MDARPTVAKPCATCGELTGRGYPSCGSCAEAIDRLWGADWPSLDADEVLEAAPGEYAWTCVDWALRQISCAGCRNELATGPPDCVGCAAADSARWECTDPAMTANERALRAAVAALRAPARYRSAVVATWRLMVPFLLVGEPPPALLQVRTQVLAGRYAELAALDSLVELVELPLLPWRRSGAKERAPSGLRSASKAPAR